MPIIPPYDQHREVAVNIKIFNTILNHAYIYLNKELPKYDKALDNQNPSNMYPSGRLARSTTSGYETKWWLDDKVEEKPGVTPANDHLAKRPVKTHIFSRKEMEALEKHNSREVSRQMVKKYSLY